MLIQDGRLSLAPDQLIQRSFVSCLQQLILRLRLRLSMRLRLPLRLLVRVLLRLLVRLRLPALRLRLDKYG